MQGVAEVLHRKVRRVDHLVGAGPQLHEHAALLVDRRLDAAWSVDRMAVAGLAVAVEQHVVGGVEEEKMCARAGPVEGVELLLRVREEQAAARVDHERDLLLAAFAGDFDRRRHQRRRKVVEGVVAEVLEDLHRLRFARAGESCDDDEVRLTRGGQSGRIHDRTTPTIEITIAPRNAARGPFTLNPSAGISETTYSISAPITKWKMPSVRQVIG